MTIHSIVQRRYDVSPQTIQIENVSSSHPGTDSLVLHDITFEIKPGEIVALVGVSGSGKTSLANLLAGLYLPTSGKITDAGVDIDAFVRFEYRRPLAWCFRITCATP